MFKPERRNNKDIPRCSSHCNWSDRSSTVTCLFSSTNIVSFSFLNLHSFTGIFSSEVKKFGTPEIIYAARFDIVSCFTLQIVHCMVYVHHKMSFILSSVKNVIKLSSHKHSVNINVSCEIYIHKVTA